MDQKSKNIIGRKITAKYVEVMYILELIFTLSETHAYHMVTEYPDDLNASINNELTQLRVFFPPKAILSIV